MTTDTKINPIEVEKYLRGVDFPTSKEDLIECAKNNDAPEEIIESLHQIKNQEYASPIDISKQIGKLNH